MGIGSYRPRRVVDNDEICTLIDSSDEWIRTRSGIRERRWASPDETVQMMSVSAARMAIERAGLDPAQIDTVIVATVTHLYQTPSAAATIAAELGTNGAAFDISAACAGFCYGLTLADSLVRTGRVHVRAGDRRGAAVRHHQPRGPLHRLHLRRRGRRGRRRTERPDPPSVPWSGAPTASSPD